MAGILNWMAGILQELAEAGGEGLEFEAGVVGVVVAEDLNDVVRIAGGV